MIFYYALAFLCGALTKLTDNFVDEPFKSKHTMLPYATGLAYGLLAGFLATRTAEFATLIIAITVGVLVAGKIDSREHQLAVATLFIFAAFFGLPAISFPLLGALLTLGFLDEILNDFVDGLKERRKKININIKRIVNARISLEAGTLAFGLYSGNFVFFFAILAFDLAYNIIDRIMPLFLERFDPGYGAQLAIDLYKCDARKLASKWLVEKMLNSLPARIGMRKIAEPQVFQYTAALEKDSGLSGFVLIAESHITIHTYPLQGLAKIDVVSCKAFDPEKTVLLLKKAFSAREAETQLLQRGKHYPSNPKKARKIVEKERIVF